ncbi:DUF4148 domain-containing protein [Cupriavidus sp. CP313]
MKHARLFSLAAMLIVSALTSAAHAADGGGTAHQLTREEVRADLDAWYRSGLAELWSGDVTPDVSSADYQRRLASYERLRAAQAPKAKH